MFSSIRNLFASPAKSTIVPSGENVRDDPVDFRFVEHGPDSKSVFVGSTVKRILAYYLTGRTHTRRVADPS